MKLMNYDVVDRVRHRCSITKKEERGGNIPCIHCGDYFSTTESPVPVMCTECRTKQFNRMSLAILLLKDIDNISNAVSIACQNIPKDSPRFGKSLNYLKRRIANLIKKC